jgi:hypothetical protein
VSTYNGIEIINIDTNKTERRIKTSQQCYGITYHHGVLLWCEQQKGIQMMKLSDDRITTFKFPQLVPLYRVACDGVSVTVCLIYLLSTCCYIGVRRQFTLFN